MMSEELHGLVGVNMWPEILQRCGKRARTHKHMQTRPPGWADHSEEQWDASTYGFVLLKDPIRSRMTASRDATIFIDLSFLSPEEEEIIQKVLVRDEHLKKHELGRVRWAAGHNSGTGSVPRFNKDLDLIWGWIWVGVFLFIDFILLRAFIYSFIVSQHGNFQSKWQQSCYNMHRKEFDLFAWT